jgi:hypothetical protein
MSPANQSQDQVIKPIVINNPKFTFQWSEPDDHPTPLALDLAFIIALPFPR